MTDANVYYVAIPSISCNNCAGKIKSHLLAKRYIHNVDIDMLSKRAKVLVNKGTPPKQILEDLVECDDKFKDSKLLTAKQTIYFSIEGLNTSDDSDRLRAALRNMSNIIRSYEINFPTKTVKLELIESDTKEAINTIQETIRKASRLRLMPMSLSEEGETNKTHYKRYYKNAITNLLVGLPLWVINMMGWIPLPFTLLGQVFGLGLGLGILAVMYYTGRDFYKQAWKEFAQRRSYDMNTLIALGTGSAWFYSMLLVLFPTFFPLATLHYQFVAVNMILGIVNFGKGLRESLQDQTRKGVKKIEDTFAQLQPQRATRLNLKFKHNLSTAALTQANVDNISYEDIKRHDIIVVRENERIPVEGVIIGIQDRGHTRIDQSNLTGESRPSVMRVGSAVNSGSLNVGPNIYICATRDGNKSNLSKMINDAKKQVNRNETSISTTIDKIAKFFVPTIISLAVLSGVGWFIWGPVPQLAFAIKSFLSVMLCACPCALGLATPISTTISIYKLFKEGILVHRANLVEKISQIDALVFDKTGTLTRPYIREVHPTKPDWDEKTLIKYVASLENTSSHPIAHAFDDRLQDMFKVTYSETLDSGIEGVIEKDRSSYFKLIVGSREQLKSKGVHISRACYDKEAQWEKSGYTSVYVAVSKDQKANDLERNPNPYHCVGMIALHHRIRKDAHETVEHLKKQGIDLYILSGDNEAATKEVAEELGIEKVFGNRGAKEKEQYINKIKKNNRVVAMVGDGVNDIAAIKSADVGIAVGPWTDASTSAGIAMQKLSNLTTLITISKQAMRNIYQNIAWTGFYNLISIVAAFGAFINPVIASLAMACSSIFVVLNSWRLSSQIDNAVQKEKGLESKNGNASGFWSELSGWLKPRQVIDAFKKVIVLDDGDDDDDVICLGGSAARNDTFSPSYQTHKKIKQEPVETRPNRVTPEPASPVRVKVEKV